MSDKSNDGFVRDQLSGAVINTDNGALQAYKLKKQKERRLDIIEQRLESIEHMFKTILEKISK